MLGDYIDPCNSTTELEECELALNINLVAAYNNGFNSSWLTIHILQFYSFCNSVYLNHVIDRINSHKKFQGKPLNVDVKLGYD